jgi:hypothetical protein
VVGKARFINKRNKYTFQNWTIAEVRYPTSNPETVQILKTTGFRVQGWKWTAVVQGWKVTLLHKNDRLLNWTYWHLSVRIDSLAKKLNTVKQKWPKELYVLDNYKSSFHQLQKHTMGLYINDSSLGPNYWISDHIELW